MKERIQNRINSIKDLAKASKGTAETGKAGTVLRPNNALSRSIRSEQDALQFKAELKASIALSKLR